MGIEKLITISEEELKTIEVALRAHINQCERFKCGLGFEEIKKVKEKIKRMSIIKKNLNRRFYE